MNFNIFIYPIISCIYSKILYEQDYLTERIPRQRHQRAPPPVVEEPIVEVEEEEEGSSQFEAEEEEEKNDSLNDGMPEPIVITGNPRPMILPHT